MRLNISFWREELPIRLRSWWRCHWWPARIRQLDRERADWKRWHNDLNEQIGGRMNILSIEPEGDQPTVIIRDCRIVIEGEGAANGVFVGNDEDYAFIDISGNTFEASGD